MKQILQDLGNGETLLVDVPQPAFRSGRLLIRSDASLVSIGTEKMLIDFGKGSWLEKARQQPDKVRMVLDKVKTDGLSATYKAVKSKLETAIPLGYSNAGVVVESGDPDFVPGDRVISNGPHAEFVSVPKNLCAKIPDGVTPEAAAFTVVGAIGLEGVRLMQPTLGEAVTVTGLGLIGLLCVQILKAHGCRVLGLDYDSRKCELARQFGAEVVDLSKGGDPVSAGMEFSNGRGMDAVLITASTKSNDPVHQGAQMCRQRGRIVLVGVVGLELSRADFYEKELSFQVSCSYGPGRHDSEYEEGGRDYPFGLVRWTEQRNFEAILDLLAAGRLDVAPLISHRYEFDKALSAYENVSAGSALGVVLQYPPAKGESEKPVHRIELNKPSTSRAGSAVVGVIGAGNFSGQVLLPALKATGARLRGIVSSGGVSGTLQGRRLGFEFSSTQVDDILGDDDINLVVVATRHDSHAGFVKRALAAGKNVFVEKPLCLNESELEEIIAQVSGSDDSGFVMVGFNRRFAPHVVKMKELLASVVEPKTFVMTVNAGQIPPNHWTQDPKAGGGRIIGEGCHFIDLLRFLAGSPITEVSARAMSTTPGSPQDTVSITLNFEDGSLGVLHYLANGHKSFPKERLEVFSGGRVLALDNFRTLKGHGWKGFSKMKLWNQDKGHNAEMQAVVDAIVNGTEAPIPFAEIVEVTKASFEAARRI